VGFGIVDGQSIARRYIERFRQIGFNLAAVIILEQLGIGPVEVGTIQQVAGDRNLSAQPLQKKDGVGKLLAHFGNHITPGRLRNHIAGITAKAVNTPPAPGEKHRPP
jgi:hypothetical protein